mmetsp:Transcript_25670/g.61054  ORF Transcript_25670/g.61054 Transcript_25670/m.61054 type:complete len:199 (+) Transcript_25670:548-1144(+)
MPIIGISLGRMQGIVPRMEARRPRLSATIAGISMRKAIQYQLIQAWIASSAEINNAKHIIVKFALENLNKSLGHSKAVAVVGDAATATVVVVALAMIAVVMTAEGEAVEPDGSIIVPARGWVLQLHTEGSNLILPRPAMTFPTKVLLHLTSRGDPPRAPSIGATVKRIPAYGMIHIRVDIMICSLLTSTADGQLHPLK